jgi:hypothetical protein
VIEPVNERGTGHFLGWNDVRSHVKQLIYFPSYIYSYTSHVHTHNNVLKFHTSVHRFPFLDNVILASSMQRFTQSLVILAVLQDTDRNSGIRNKSWS